MKIYADPITINCRKVLAGLQLMNIPYERVHVDYFSGAQKNADYMAINPNAAMPSMIDGDLILWESNAILIYAAEKYGKHDVYPTDLKKRADINRWMFWESASWFPSAYVYLVEHCVKPLLNSAADPAVLSAQDANFHKLAGILDARLAQHEWLTGSTPTLADIVIASPMHMHSHQQLPLGPHKNLVRWMTQNIEKLPCWDNTYVGAGFTLQKAA
jgi:glutathione S-transferase